MSSRLMSSRMRMRIRGARNRPERKERYSCREHGKGKDERQGRKARNTDTNKLRAPLALRAPPHFAGLERSGRGALSCGEIE